MTNFDKLARWDADYYKSLTDDDCIVCLSEKQVYLLGQVIEQLTWQKTRWTGDKSGLDFDAISSELNYRLSERMTCQNLTAILNTVNLMQVQIDEIQHIINQTFNEVDNGVDVFIFNPETSVVEDNYPTSTLSDIGYESPTCTTDDKDKLYGGISQLVRYMNQKNVDFFEELAQTGNITDQINRVKEATGALNVVPLANAFDFATFYIEELIQEYEATVDENLLQTTICDLFCIAVNSGCKFSMYDVYDYFAAKVEPTFSNVATTFLDLLQYALSGTLSGDKYYYFATYFQLALAGLGQKYLDINNIDSYAFQFLAGLNSPDNDWSIFCINCPTQYREIEFDFSRGLQGWVVGTGTYENSRIRGAGSDFQKTFSITYEADPSWRIRGIRYEGNRNKDTTGTGNNGLGATFRVTAGSDVGAYFPITGQYTALGDYVRCGHINTAPNYATGVNEIRVFGQITRSGGGSGDIVEIYCDKVILQFEPAFAPDGTRITEDSNLCD